MESTKTVGGEGAILFEADYADAASQAAAAQELCRTVEANGAVLLLNRDGALPLAAGSKVSLFGNTAVNFIYSGSGSGAMDASKMKDFKQALEQDGYAVNETLWNFYVEQGKTYHREGASGSLNNNIVNNADFKVNEVPRASSPIRSGQVSRTTATRRSWSSDVWAAKAPICLPWAPVITAATSLR